MDDKVNYAFVGAFVIALGAALTAGVLWLAAGLGGKRQFVTYESIIGESVAGLNIDAPVKYLGVDVGKVSRIAIDPLDSSRVRLTLQIERETPVKRDTEAVLKTQGLTGIAYVELGGGSAGAPRLEPGPGGELPLIRSKASLGTRMESEIGSVLSNLNRLAGNLNAVFDADNRAALAQTLADTRMLVHTFAARRDTISGALDDVARAAGSAASAAAQLAPTLDRIETSARALERLADSARDAVAGARGTADAATRSADAATATMRQLDAETLPEAQRLLGELDQLAAAMRQLVEQVRRQPSALVIGAPAINPGPGESVPR